MNELDPLEEDLIRKRAARQFKAAQDPLAADLEQKRKRKALETRHAATMADIERIKAEPDPTSAWEITKAIGSEMGDRLAHMGRGAMVLGRSAIHPVDTLSDPSKRREIERGIDDLVALGYGQKLADLIVRKAGLKEPTFAETEAADVAAAPGYRAGGNILGIAFPGAGKTIAQTGGKVAQAAVKGVGALPSAGRAVLGYEASAPAITALHASSEGDRIGAALDAAIDPANVLLATGIGAAAGGFQKQVAKTRGAKAAQFLEEHPEAAKRVSKMPADDRLIGVASREAAENIESGIRRIDRATRKQPYAEAKAQVDASVEASTPRDISHIVQDMKNAAYDLETPRMARAALTEEIGLVERYRQGQDGPVMIPERQLNGLRRTLMELGGVGTTDAPGPREAPLRRAAFMAKEMVDQGPYAELNRNYAEGSEAVITRRKQLGLKKRPSKDREVEIKKIKLGLERYGQNTKTAGGDTKLDEFLRENPEFAEDIALPEAARARAELTPRLTPKHGGLIERTVGAHLGPATALLAAAQGGTPGVLGATGIMAAQNATPIAGRLLYPLSRRVSAAPGNLLLQIAEERRRRDEEAARTLRGR